MLILKVLLCVLDSVPRPVPQLGCLGLVVVRLLARTRHDSIRTLGLVAIELVIRGVEEPPMYQRIAIEAAAMYARGVRVSGIAKHFGVDHHTADKALRWFRSR